MGSEENEFWRSYRNDPERLERKSQEKRKRQDDREAQARDRKIQKVEPRTVTQSHDWLCHNGNIHFCRDRQYFESYQEFDSVRLIPQDYGPLAVHGMGTVRVDFKRQLGQDHSMSVTLANTLHVPGARCNGL